MTVVGGRREGRRRDAARHFGVEQPGPVEVDRRAGGRHRLQLVTLQIRPPDGMCVFSTVTADTGSQWWGPPASTCQATSDGSIVPSLSSIVTNWAELFTPNAPRSYATTCARRPASTAVPAAPRSRRAIWLPIVPDGTSTAASFPTRSAKASSRARTVGSSP